MPQKTVWHKKILKKRFWKRNLSIRLDFPDAKRVLISTIMGLFAHAPFTFCALKAFDLLKNASKKKGVTVFNLTLSF